LAHDASPDQFEQIARDAGLEPLRMKAGVLLSSEVSALRHLFPSLTGEEQGSIPVPAALQHIVRSVRVFRPRSFTSES
jgi:hypothetical protein